MYVVIVVVMLAAYLSSPAVAIAPSVLKLLPDVLSGLVAVYVIAVGAKQQFRNVNPKYWFIFGALLLVVACGPIVNQEAPGPIINGMRYYLRAVPFFFLPAVCHFEERDLRRYAALLLALALLQLPIALDQRFELAAEGRFTGDYVYGTLMISGILSLFLITVLCLIGALAVRGRIAKGWFAVCFVLLVIPMSINETKVSMVLLPLGMLITFFFASPPGRRWRTSAAALALLAIAGAIFVPLYNYYNTLNNPYPMTITDWFDSRTLKRYFLSEARVGSTDEAGRGDSIIVPIKQFSRDPVKLVFGLGIGNASLSSLGNQFTGRYKSIYWTYVQTTSASAFLFEIGLLGTLLVLGLHFMWLRDAVVVARGNKGLTSDLAPGYIGAWVVITIGLFYLTIHTFESLSFVFFFLSGLIAARRTELARFARDGRGLGPKRRAQT
jgi:O-antigen ligase